ncbi:MAG: flagellar assembly protein FliH [Treponema sp.]|nr:flagellar assembly protein FliH [Treponema sp.]
MNKSVFRPGELILSDEKVFLEPPQAYEEKNFNPGPVLEELDEIPEIPEFTGPTADDLRREAELFKSHWEEEREGMIREARDRVDEIIQDARTKADEETRRAKDDAEGIKKQAEAEAEKILAEAGQKAEEIESSGQAAFDNERREAADAGFKEGREAGYTEGRAEADRLIERVRTVLERAQSRREEILVETERQIVDLVLLMARKVVKIISETQEEVVKANVVQALRKLKGHGNIIVRVNMRDVKLTTEHINSFIKQMEGIKGVHMAEDSSVDPGGCIIETDFGEIDARISSQLAELEAKILEMSPIKTRLKGAASLSAAAE